MSKAVDSAVTSFAENMDNITASEDEQPTSVVDKQKEVEAELQEEFHDSKNNRTLFRASRQLIYRQSSAMAIDGDHSQNSDCVMSG